MASNDESGNVPIGGFLSGGVTGGGRGERTPKEVRDELMKLAVIAAHQLKSPLSSIQTTLSLLLGGFMGSITPAQRDLLEKATASCTRGTNLVGDLLRLRGLDILASDDMVRVNLSKTFIAAIDRVKDFSEAQQVVLKHQNQTTEDDDAWVVADPNTIGEILHVFLDNAIKYTPKGGQVECRLFTDVASGDVGARGGLNVCFEVIDTGIGIPSDSYNKLFAEFYRAPNARAMSQEGTGLGLAFAAQAVRLHGGHLEMRPADTGGVHVLVTIPQVEAPEVGTIEITGISRRSQVRISQRVVIIGGVTAGSKAAARIIRLDPDADVTIVERGRFLSYAGCGLPYYIAGAVREQRELVSSPLGEFRDSFFFHNLRNVRALDLTEAREIDRVAKTVTVHRILDDGERVLKYDKLIMATGARAFIPDLANRHLKSIYTLHGVEDAEAIRAELRSQSAKEVVIVGGGILGTQITEAVAIRGSRITLVEANPSILGAVVSKHVPVVERRTRQRRSPRCRGVVDPELAALVERHMVSRGIRVSLGVPVVGFEGDTRVKAVLLADGQRLPCDFVILAVGVVPNVTLARQAGLRIGETGAVWVDHELRTSDPDIYAVGDCAETTQIVTGKSAWVPMGSTAVKQGRIAANNICGRHATFPGVVGSTVIKVFDYTVSCTGLSEAEARAEGFDPVSATIPGPDRAHYLPSANPIIIKMVVDRGTRRLLGAQGIGTGDVVKRIDVVASALTSHLDLDAISVLDLAFAPAYSLAMDPVISAANVLENKLDGLFQSISSIRLQERLQEGDPPLLLDIRLPSEYGLYRMPDSLHVPLGSLRGRLNELPRNRDIVTICKIGVRAYEAALILQKAGFTRVWVLDGGLDAWPFELERL